MPAYLYRCDRAECRSEAVLNAPMKDRAALEGKPCRACGEGSLKRTYAAPAVLGAGLGDIS